MAIPNRYTIASDNFNRANENPLSDGGNFTTLNGKFALQLVSNAVQPGGFNNGCFEVWNNGVWPNDQWMSISVTALAAGSSGANGPQGFLRSANIAGATTYYQFVCRAVTGASISKNVSGVSTTLASDATKVPANGDVFVFTVIGNVLTVYQNGVSILTATDSVIASGNPGISCYQQSSSTTQLILDNWSAGGFSNNTNLLMMMGCGT